MHRTFVVIGVFIALLGAVLFSSVPVFADSFSASVALDLRSLTFSGIPVSLSQVIPHPTEPTFSNIPPQTQNSFLFHHAANGAFLQDNISSPTWADGTVTEHLPAVGKATSLINSTELSSSMMLLTSGLAGSLTARDALLTASQTGALTVSIDYSLRHSGAVVGDPDFLTVGRAGLSVGRFGEATQQRHFADLFLPPLDVPKMQQGTLSVTRFFNAGESTLFEIFTTVAATVPEADMLLSTLVGLVGIAVLARRRAMCA